MAKSFKKRTSTDFNLSDEEDKNNNNNSGEVELGVRDGNINNEEKLDEFDENS